jgi:hypothetical protein
LKNILKISDELNAVATIPRKVLKPEEEIKKIEKNRDYTAHDFSV